MDNSFTLLSTMSPKINKTKRRIPHNTVPTKLALKKNIRRSSIVNNLPFTVTNDSIVLVEESTTDASTSDGSHVSSSIINTTPIVISDSDSAELEDSLLHTNTSQDNHSLSKYKFVAINEWVTNVNSETKNKRQNSSLNVKSEICNEDVHKHSGIETNLYNLEELMKGISNLFDKPNAKGQAADINEDKSSVKSTEVKESGTVSAIVPLANKRNDDADLSFDIIEGSDCSSDHNKSCEDLLDELYGHKWRQSKDAVLPKSEPRKKKAINLDKYLPKTERKPKPKMSITHKNPYLEAQQKTVKNQVKATLTSPWVQRLAAVCDSDSSEQSFNGALQKFVQPPTRLLFSNQDIADGNEFSASKKYNKINGKSNANVSAERSKQYKEKPISDKIVKHFNTSCSLNEGNIDISNRMRNKILSDSSDDSEILARRFSVSSDEESLEERIRKKLLLNTKSSPAFEKKKKETGNTVPDMKQKDPKISTKKVKSKTDSDNHKLLTTDIEINVKTVTKSKLPTKTKIPKQAKNKTASATTTKHARFLNNLSEVESSDCKSFLASLSRTVKDSECDPSARIFRNNYKAYKNELKTKLFKLFNEEVFDSAIPDDSPLEWSDRMTKTGGFCYSKKVTRRTGLVERKVRIVLATKVVDCAERLRDVLIHEMCHAATWIVNQVSDGHGTYWKAWAIKACRIFPELPPIMVCHRYEISTKYTYKCVDCGYSIGRHSKSLDIERKRCGYCYGKFTVFINKTTKQGETKTVPVTPKKQATPFALFIKENYATYKTPQLDHRQIMKLLGQKFNELKVSVN